MSLSKKIYYKGTLRQVFFLSVAPSPPMTPYSPPPLHTTYTVYLFTQGGRGELTREKVRGAIVHKAGRKYQHDWLYLQSTYKLPPSQMSSTIWRNLQPFWYSLSGTFITSRAKYMQNVNTRFCERKKFGTFLESKSFSTFEVPWKLRKTQFFFYKVLKRKIRTFTGVKNIQELASNLIFLTRHR